MYRKEDIKVGELLDQTPACPGLMLFESKFYKEGQEKNISVQKPARNIKKIPEGWGNEEVSKENGVYRTTYYLISC